MTSPDDLVSRIPYGELGLIGDYLLACRDDGLRARTIVLKYQRLTATQALMGADLASATEDDAGRWWRRLAGQSLSNATRATYLSHLRAFYAWAVLSRWVEADPTRRVRPPKRPKGLPRDVDPAAVLQAVAAMDPRPRMMLGLALWCGMRCAEIAAVRPVRDVTERADGRHVLRVTGKGGVVRVVTLPAHLVQDLSGVGPGWAFPRRGDPAHHVSASWVSEHGGRLLTDAAVPATMHQLRHTYATALLQRTGDLALVATQLGHASVATAQVYARARALDAAVVDALFDQSSQSSGSGSGSREDRP